MKTINYLLSCIGLVISCTSLASHQKEQFNQQKQRVYHAINFLSQLSDRQVDIGVKRIKKSHPYYQRIKQAMAIRQHCLNNPDDKCLGYTKTNWEGNVLPYPAHPIEYMNTILLNDRFPGAYFTLPYKGKLSALSYRKTLKIIDPVTKKMITFAILHRNLPKKDELVLWTNQSWAMIYEMIYLHKVDLPSLLLNQIGEN